MALKAAKPAAPKAAKAVAAQWEAKAASHQLLGLAPVARRAAVRLPKAELPGAAVRPPKAELPGAAVRLRRVVPQRAPRALRDKPVLPLPAPVVAARLRLGRAASRSCPAAS